MKNLTTTQIRSLFLNFFESKSHKVLPSSFLVPQNDKSLLFTNAGMVQFKDIFTGLETPDFLRATTSQKCIRAGGKHNDLENVGYTARHHTFFEMLGNFSFGEYFKEEAIKFAWEFLTECLEISKEKLIVTVYHDDDEAFDLWKKILPESKIIRISTKDNFWEMGDSGPCGPCSEIFYDYGENYKGSLPGSSEQDDGERYIEIWNLVFMQYEKINGELKSLPKKSVDTGMGLERIAAVCQGKHDNYKTDIFQRIIDEIKKITGVQFKEELSDKNYICARVVADHLRASAFLISEGVIPGNNGRNYVLKRIIRRSTIYLYEMGYSKSLIYKLVPILVNLMSDQYPQLKENQSSIETTIKNEEESFFATLERGFKQCNEVIQNLDSSKIISGEDAFKLYDTFGLPLDITIDIAKSHNLKVDIDGFNREMEKQKEIARASWKDDKSFNLENKELLLKIFNKYGETQFTGYDSKSEMTTLLSLFKSGEKQIAIFDKSPCYAESGGQIGDYGLISDDKERLIGSIVDVQKYNGLYLHEVKLNFDMEESLSYKISFDNENRKKIRANHTATHLLHKALKLVLGESVNQKGSLVNQDKLRFDFNYNKPISNEMLQKIENIVNEAIYNNLPVSTEIQNRDDAIKLGAMALFGEKYGDKVRVVRIGDDSDFSIELCGGTHIKNTGEILVCKIISEELVSSGVRRIEAVTGLAAINYLNNQSYIIKNLEQTLKCKENELLSCAETLMTKNLQLQKELNIANKELILKNIFESKNTSPFVYFHCKNQDIKIMREIAMELSRKEDKLYLLIDEVENSNSIFLSVGKDLVDKYPANILLQKIANDMNFKPGGGNKSMASTNASGINIDKLKNLLEKELILIN